MVNIYHKPITRKRTEYNGVWYDSQMEANRAAILDVLKRAGKVEWVLRQVPIDIGEPGIDKPFRVDFVVCEGNHVYAEEVTGFMTESKRRHINQWRKKGPFPLHIITTRNVEIIYPDGLNE